MFQPNVLLISYCSRVFDTQYEIRRLNGLTILNITEDIA
jgi:hypothetical protein